MQNITINVLFLCVCLSLYGSITLLVKGENVDSSVNCVKMLKNKYQNENWRQIIVRPADDITLICDVKPKSDLKAEYSKVFYMNRFRLDDPIEDEEVKRLSLEQNIRSVGIFEKNKKSANVFFMLSLINTPKSAEEHLQECLDDYTSSARVGIFIMPQKNLATTDYRNTVDTWNVFQADQFFLETDTSYLKKYCEYFFTFSDHVPNNGVFSMRNLLVDINDMSRPTPKEIKQNDFIKTKPDRKDIIELANCFSSLFDDPPQKVNVKDVPESQLILKVVKQNDGDCHLAWKLTSNNNDELYGYWLRCEVSDGNIAISEEDTVKFKRGLSITPITLERPCDDGMVLISDIPKDGTTLTAYAISPDGKTWYKKTLTIPPAGSLEKNVVIKDATEETDAKVSFRVWKSLDGKFERKGKYVSSDGTNVKLELEDGKTVTAELSKLSQEDQKYVKSKQE